MKISLLLVVYAFHAVFYVIFSFIRLEFESRSQGKDRNEGKYSLFYVFFFFRVFFSFSSIISSQYLFHFEKRMQ